MKKPIFSILILSATVLLLNGCTSGASQANSENISTETVLVDSINEKDSASAIQEKSYNNIHVASNFSLSIPEASKLDRLTLQQDEPISKDALTNVLHQALEQYFSDLYTKEELQTFAEQAQYQDGMYFLENDSIGLTVLQPGYVHAYNRGVSMALDTEPSPANVYFPADTHSVLQTYSDDTLTSQDIWSLTDGTCSVNDAVQQVETQLQKETDNSFLLPIVQNVQVVSLTDTIQVMQMEVNLEYGGISFDSADSLQNGTFEYTALSDSENTKQYCFLPGTVVVAEKGAVDFQIGVCTNYKLTATETSENCISPESAIQLASSYLTDQVVFEADKMELVYASYTISEDDEAEKKQADPVWKIRTYNKNDNLYYAIYVDALTGACDCYQYAKE